MTSGWRGGSQGQTGVASSLPATFRSTKCPAPNTPRTTTQQAPCHLCPLGPRVQAVRSTHLACSRHCPLSAPHVSAPNESTPPSIHLHPCLMVQHHSHTRPFRHRYPKNLPIIGLTIPPNLLHLPTTTLSALHHHLLLQRDLHIAQ